MRILLAVHAVVIVLVLLPLPTDAQTLDQRNLSGVWQLAPGGGGQGPGDHFPPLTAWGQAKYDANKPGYGPKAAPGGNDPILKCDPMGFPRIMFAIWPFEIIHVPGRILMFFEGHHTIREIWMDGRKLPDDPDPRWYGYSVGHWEDDYTFVINSNGTDDRTWLDNAGNPHSDQLKVEERWHRISEKRLELTVTLDDPKAYTRPWVALDKLQFVQIPESVDLIEMMNAASEVQTVAEQYKKDAAPR